MTGRLMESDLDIPARVGPPRAVRTAPGGGDIARGTPAMARVTVPGPAGAPGSAAPPAAGPPAGRAAPRRRAQSGLRGWMHRLRSVRDGADESIVTELYREYHRPLLAFVMRLTGDRQWAEDVVQETMIRAWRSVDQLDTEASSLMPWLATVARRIVIDDRRRKEARPREAGEAPLENVQIPDDVEDLLRTVVVVEALKALTPAHREVLTETILRDRSVNEAAKVLGIPVGTVKSRVYYALRALRVALEERGVSAQ